MFGRLFRRQSQVPLQTRQAREKKKVGWLVFSSSQGFVVKPDK